MPAPTYPIIREVAANPHFAALSEHLRSEQNRRREPRRLTDSDGHMLFNMRWITQKYLNFVCAFACHAPDLSIGLTEAIIRAQQILHLLATAATSHAIRSRTHPIYNDQWSWALRANRAFGCAFTDDGRIAHGFDRLISPLETEVVRHVSIELQIGRVLTEQLSNNSSSEALREAFRAGHHLDSHPRDALCIFLPISGCTHIMTQARQYHISHNEIVNQAEIAIARERAREGGGHTFRRLDGDPRTSDKSVLFSRWNRAQ